MAGGAKRFPDEGDRHKSNRDIQNDMYALIRNRHIAPQRIQAPTTGTSGGGTTIGATSGDFLDIRGGTMLGPIAFDPELVSISGAGRINIAQSTTHDASWVLVTGAGSPDDLNWIDGARFNGQILVLQGTASQIINVKHATTPGTNGNIVTHDGTDVVLDSTIATNCVAVVTLLFDPIVTGGGAWRVINTSKTTTSSGANTTLSNLTSPTAINQHLLPGTTNVFDFGSPSQKWHNGHFSNVLQVAATAGSGSESLGANTIIQVAGDDLKSDIQSTNYGTTSWPAFVTRHARGTFVTPTALKVNDYIGMLAASGYDGSSFSSPTGFISARATQDWTATHHGTQTEFFVIPDDSITGVESVNIRQDGTTKFFFGVQVKIPSGTLTIPSDTAVHFVLDGSAATGTKRRVMIESYGSSPGNLFLRKTDGTIAAPTALATGVNSNIGAIIFSGWDGATYISSGVIQGRITAAWSVGSNPTLISFSTTPVGSATVTPAFTITESQDIVITSGKNLYLDGSGSPLAGGDTYISESGANLIELKTGGSVAMYWDSAQNTVIPETKKLYLDGAVDSYLWVPATGADRIEIITGGTDSLTYQFKNVGFTMTRNASFDEVIRRDTTAAIGVIGSIQFQTNRTTGGLTTFGKIQCEANSISNTAYSGYMFVEVPVNGTQRTFINIQGNIGTGLISLGWSGGYMGFFGSSGNSIQTSAGDLTNSVTSGGTDDTIANFTSLTVYATDAATIRNDIYQLARKLKQVNDALRSYGLLT